MTADRVGKIRAGDRATIARAITEIERGMPSADALAAALAPHAGRAHVVGITGPPGAGKSTLIDALVREHAARGLRVAVVAIDPSSPITGGAVLGDRIRMAASGADDAVFIRSLASRGHPGGLAKPARRIVDLLDAAGFDLVVVETVGAGQSDVDVAALADTSVVVCPPGLGDGVQAINAGILEIGDLLVVSKGDQPDAGRTAHDLQELLHLRAGNIPPRRASAPPPEGAGALEAVQRAPDDWKVRVIATSATTDAGVAALADALAEHAKAEGTGRRLRRAANLPDADPATATLRAFSEADPYQRHNGLVLVDAGPTHATMTMTVARHHLNFNGGCHGGAMFTLADSAFGLAANAHGVVAVGIDTHMTFLLAVREGETLTAHAVEVSRNAKLAVYRVDVTNGAGAPVATFTGTVHVTRRPHAPR